MGLGGGEVGCLGGALFAGFRGLVVEDGHELVAALGGREGLPAGESSGAGVEGAADERRELDFGFHGGEQALGELLRAVKTGGVGFDAVNPFADFSAVILGERVVEVAEAFGFVEEVVELAGELGRAGFEVGCEGEVCRIAEEGSTALLHGSIDQDEEVAGGFAERE